MVGVVVKQCGAFHSHGGARRAAAQKSSAEKFAIFAIGEENFTLSTESIASALHKGHFYEAVKRFGVYLQIDSIRNHNFVCNSRDATAKYFIAGHPCWMVETKQTVCREVFGNWVRKFAQEVNNNRALDEEAVAFFHMQKEEYLELVEDESLEIQKREKKAVQMVSDVAKSCRKVHEQKSGNKIDLVLS